MAALDFPSSPTNGQTYTANGSTWTYDSATTSWVSANASGGGGGGATGGGTDKAFYENDITITTSYTLTTNKNALTAGPVTINSGATVTVPPGQTWTIV